MSELKERIVITVKKTVPEDQIQKTWPIYESSTEKTFLYERFGKIRPSPYHEGCVEVTYKKGREIETVEEEPEEYLDAERTYNPLGARILSEDEVIRDIKKNTTLSRVSLNSLLDDAKELISLRKEDFIRHYSSGFFTAEFINQESRISFSVQEALPIAFALAPTISVRMIQKAVTTSKASQALNYLSEVEIIEVKNYNDQKTAFRINPFNTIKNGLADDISEKEDVEKKAVARRFQNELGTFRDGINETSKKSTSTYNKFNEWLKKKGRKGPHFKLIETFHKESRK